jgi:hypothetical protein
MGVDTTMIKIYHYIGGHDLINSIFVENADGQFSTRSILCMWL